MKTIMHVSLNFSDSPDVQTVQLPVGCDILGVNVRGLVVIGNPKSSETYGFQIIMYRPGQAIPDPYGKDNYLGQCNGLFIFEARPVVVPGEIK